MKPNNLSLWAKNNPHKAQMCIAIGHIATIILSIELGILLLAMGIKLPNWLLPLCTAAAIAAVWFYPNRNEQATSQVFHQKRRPFDVILLTMGVLMAVAGTNGLTSSALDAAADVSENGRVNMTPSSPLSKFDVFQEAQPTVLLKALKSKETVKTQKHSAKEWLQKRMVKKYHSYKNDADDMGGKIALTILLIVALAFFEYWLAILSCTISCNGMQALAVAVFIGGTILGCLLAVTIFQKLFPPKIKQIQKPKNG